MCRWRVTRKTYVLIIKGAMKGTFQNKIYKWNISLWIHIKGKEGINTTNNKYNELTVSFSI